MKSQLLRLIFSFILLIGTFNSFSQSPGKIFKDGKEAAEAGKTDEAIDLFTKVIALKPKDDDVLVERAKAYEKKKEYEKAIADYDKALDIDNKDEKLFLR